MDTITVCGPLVACADGAAPTVSDLTTAQRAFLEEAYRQCPDLRTIQQHLTRFITIVRQREHGALES